MFEIVLAGNLAVTYKCIGLLDGWPTTFLRGFPNAFAPFRTGNGFEAAPNTLGSTTRFRQETAVAALIEEGNVNEFVGSSPLRRIQQ